MKLLRRTRFLPSLLALIILAGYSGFGFYEHICYSQHQRIFSLSFEPAGCNHNIEETCCNEHKTDLCELGNTCCDQETATESDQIVFQGVCCEDHYHFSSIPDDILLVKHSYKILKVAEIIGYQQNTIIEKPVKGTEGVTLFVERPPNPARKKLLLLHQMRLDPDLA